MRLLRRLRFVTLAIAFAAGTLLYNPSPAAAACYYGPWKTDTREVWAMSHNVRVKSTVTFRLGYTCGGSPTGEWHVTERKMWINIWGGGTYQGPQRWWTAHHLYPSWTSGVPEYGTPNRKSTSADVSWFHVDYGDRYGSTGDPFVYFYCSACTPSGMGNFWGQHHFLVPQRMWINWNSI